MPIPSLMNRDLLNEDLPLEGVGLEDAPPTTLDGDIGDTGEDDNE